MTPYVTRTGIRIGLLYQPRPPRPSWDQERLQKALLDPRTAAPRPALQRVLGAAWGWL